MKLLFTYTWDINKGFISTKIPFIFFNKTRYLLRSHGIRPSGKEIQFITDCVKYTYIHGLQH